MEAIVKDEDVLISGPLSMLLELQRQSINECLDLSKMGRIRVPITDPARLLPAAPEPVETISIQIFKDDQFGAEYVVRIGDRYQDHLCWDEAMVLTMGLLMHPERFRQRLHTSEEHCNANWRARYAMQEYA